MTKWEYLIGEPDYSELSEHEFLNRWGRACNILRADGWELVGIAQYTNAEGDVNICHYFKRPIREDGDEDLHKED